MFYGYTDTTAVIPPKAILDNELRTETRAETRTKTKAAGSADAPQTSASQASPQKAGAFAHEGTLAFGHPLRIFYPSLDGSPQDAPMLTGCGRYPLVIFAHGECLEDDHYKKWFELPATLARCGYVVLVPELSGASPNGNEAEQEMVAALGSWARSTWSGHESLMPSPATALIGHSHGGGNTSRIVGRSPHEYAAFVSLSGVGVGGTDVPKLFMVGNGFGEVLGVPISEGVESLSEPAHYVVLEGAGHWDYLRQGRTSCEANTRGPCSINHQVATDIVACFLTRYLRPEGVPFVSLGPFDFFRVERSLRPPRFWKFLLTNEQEFFAGGHLSSWGLAAERDECGLTSYWKVGGERGSLVMD